MTGTWTKLAQQLHPRPTELAQVIDDLDVEVLVEVPLRGGTRKSYRVTGWRLLYSTIAFEVRSLQTDESLELWFDHETNFYWDCIPAGGGTWIECPHEQIWFRIYSGAEVAAL